MSKFTPFKIGMSTHRSFLYVTDILLTEALGTAACAAAVGYRGPPDIGTLKMRSLRCGGYVELKLNGYVAASISGIVPDIIRGKMFTKETPGIDLHLAGLDRIGSRVQNYIYSSFADAVIEWMRVNISTGYDRWPPVANFGRVVRNAIVHGGTINIASETAPEVEWRGLRLGHKNLGEALFDGIKISPGDLIPLMIEMDHELDSLGAPLSLR